MFFSNVPPALEGREKNHVLRLRGDPWDLWLDGHEVEETLEQGLQAIEYIEEVASHFLHTCRGIPAEFTSLGRAQASKHRLAESRQRSHGYSPELKQRQKRV